MFIFNSRYFIYFYENEKYYYFRIFFPFAGQLINFAEVASDLDYFILFFSWAGEDAPKILKIFILTPLSLIKTRTTLSCRLQFSNQPRLFLALKHASFSLSKTPAFVPCLCNWCGDGSFELFPRRLLQCRSRRIFAGKARAEAWRPFHGRGLARFPQ